MSATDWRPPLMPRAGPGPWFVAKGVKKLWACMEAGTCPPRKGLTAFGCHQGRCRPLLAGWRPRVDRNCDITGGAFN